VLGMFIDFFEIAFIVVPLLAPVAAKILPELLPGVPESAVMIWFGVILAMNLQTSFLTPPFGFALFYLRSVAARQDYDDRITGARIPAVTTGQIYKGSIAFIVLQLLMVVIVIAYPRLVLGSLIETGPKIDVDQAFELLMEKQTQDLSAPSNDPFAPPPPRQQDAPASNDPFAPPAPSSNNDDPMRSVLEALKDDAQKK